MSAPTTSTQTTTPTPVWDEFVQLVGSPAEDIMLWELDTLKQVLDEKQWTGVKRGTVEAYYKKHKAAPLGLYGGLGAGRDTIFGDGDCFPKLGDRRLADSAPSMPGEEHHLPAKIMKRSFLKEFQPPLPMTTHKLSSTIWSMKRTKNLNWTHEPDIQTFVEYAIEDIILMYGLEITLAREVSITALRPDFWVVRIGSIPIGVIEVKIPCEGDESTLQDERAAGQVLDYLLTLRSTVGLCGSVFAILSTYKSWRVFWLRTRTQEAEKQTPVGSGLLSKFNDLSVCNTEETEEDREDEEDEGDKDTIDKYKEIEVEGEPNDHSVPYVDTLWDRLRSHNTPASDCEEEEEQEALPPSSRKRAVFADSKIYDIGDSTKLREVIATALCLMHKNSVFRRQVNVHRNLLLGVNQTHWLWIEPLGKMFKLHPDKFPNNNAKQLVLLADLGAGLHGRVWLSCSTGGAMCVMKFFTEHGNAKKELAFWKKAYPGTRARIQTFMDKDALIMPPFPPCMHAQKTTSETRDAVKQAVEALLNKGIWHGDLRWENFGFHKEGSTLTAYAFDFGKSVEFHPSEKAEYEEKVAAKLAMMFAEQ